jgi:hypothetical protein
MSHNGRVTKKKDAADLRFLYLRATNGSEKEMCGKRRRSWREKKVRVECRCVGVEVGNGVEECVNVVEKARAGERERGYERLGRVERVLGDLQVVDQERLAEDEEDEELGDALFISPGHLDDPIRGGLLRLGVSVGLMVRLFILTI